MWHPDLPKPFKMHLESQSYVPTELFNLELAGIHQVNYPSTTLRSVPFRTPSNFMTFAREKLAKLRDIKVIVRQLSRCIRPPVVPLLYHRLLIQEVRVQSSPSATNF